jgi:gamma-glutamyltranspeptidase/glutathione hydrolase
MKNRPPTGLVTDKAMVVSARKSLQLCRHYEKRRKCFDAMVATEFIGIGILSTGRKYWWRWFYGFQKSHGETGAPDYEKAPLASATKDMYLDAEGNVIEGKSTALGSSLNGTLAGLFKCIKIRFLPIAEILAPVIALAENGVVVTEFQPQSLANYRETFIKTNGPNSLFSQVYKAGDTIKYPA